MAEVLVAQPWTPKPMVCNKRNMSVSSHNVNTCEHIHWFLNLRVEARKNIQERRVAFDHLGQKDSRECPTQTVTADIESKLFALVVAILLVTILVVVNVQNRVANVSPRFHRLEGILVVGRLT